MAQPEREEPNYRALVELRQNDSQIYDDIIGLRKKDQRSLRLHRWGDLLAQIIGHGAGLWALLQIIDLARDTLNQGNPVQAAWMIGTSAAAIIGVFVTGRWAKPRIGGGSAHPPQPQPSLPGPNQGGG